MIVTILNFMVKPKSDLITIWGSIQQIKGTVLNLSL